MHLNFNALFVKFGERGKNILATRELSRSIYNVSGETCASSIATTGRTPRGPRWSRTTFLTFANVVQRCTKVLMSDQGNVQTSR